MSESLSRLGGLAAIVTGASSGNGRSIAVNFAQHGAKVLCVDLQADPINAEVEGSSDPTHVAIQKAGGTAEFMKVNVTSGTEVEAAIQKAVSLWGKLDIMVNNAGVLGQAVLFADEPENVYDRTLAVNTKGAFLGTQYAIRQMRKQERRQGDKGCRGSIINIASGAGIRTVRMLPSYSTSKWACVGLTKAAALDHAADKITINAVCPGPIRTALSIVGLEDPAVRDIILNQIPFGEVGLPQNVADACVFLASNEAAWITGAALPVDGAYTIA